MTFTVINRSGSIEGFNSYGQRFAAVFNGGRKFFVGRGGKCDISHRTAEGELASHAEALAWVVKQLTSN